jgi:hypothetical protein
MLLVITSCKKNENSPAPDPVITPPVQNSALQPGIGANANSLHGVLMGTIFEVPGLGMNYSTALGIFNNAPQKYGVYYRPEGRAVSPGVYAGVLKYNSDTVDYLQNGPQGFYYEYNIANVSTATWELEAISPFTSFTTTVTRGFPVQSGTNFLPDSVNRSAGLTLQLSNIFSNTDSLFVFITDQNFMLSRHLPGNASSVNFTTAELQQFVNATCQISVMAHNYSNQTINGKNLMYVMQRYFTEDVTLY